MKVAFFGLLLAAVAALAAGWRHEAIEFAQFRATIAAQGEAAKKAAKLENEKHEQVLHDVSNAWNAAIGPAQDSAVARYRAAHPERVQQCPGGSSMPVVAGSSGGADGTICERGAAPADHDSELIRACASDALKVEMWQTWASRNAIPVR